MVLTYELTQHVTTKIAEHGDMASASASMPSGAYTTFRTYESNRLLRLDQHLHRLEDSVELIRAEHHLIDATNTRDAIRNILRDTGYVESRFRLTFAPPKFYLSIEPFTPLPLSIYKTGVRCVTLNLHRDTPRAKSTSFIASADAARKTLPPDVNEGLMIDSDGSVLEGLSSNFFAVTTQQKISKDGESKDAMIHTERERVLLGVTRSLVIEVAQQIATVTENAIHLNELHNVREAFITSVSREILPVNQIDDIVIGDGKPGEITNELMRRFDTLVQLEAETIA
jgi:branched-subunit amino acid aminotransferase/4-amino-4-deoxychorismate lyase